MTGKLYGVGVGPGDPELITLKAVRIIGECDVIAYPQTGKEKNVALDIAKKVISTLLEKEILPLDIKMFRDKLKAVENRNAVAKSIMKKLDEGKNVAFLTLGDPTIYSTYMYTHKRAIKKGYRTEVIAGVPSFCAAAAVLNTHLVEGNEPLIIIPASYENTEYLISQRGTKVLMKTGKSLERVKKVLSQNKLLDDAKLVSNCGLDEQKVYNSMTEMDEDTGYFSIIIAK